MILFTLKQKVTYMHKCMNICRKRSGKIISNYHQDYFWEEICRKRSGKINIKLSPGLLLGREMGFVGGGVGKN